MADTVAPAPAAPRRASRLPLIVGLVLALICGGAGFYVTYSGLIGGAAHSQEAGTEVEPLGDLAFVPIEPVIVSLGAGGEGKHLRFRAQLEVNAPHSAEVTLLLPRILDVLNGYLRAVDPKELQDPAALLRIRAQLLRRIQMVTGEGRVRDLLVSEFVMN
jgi:flagellar protein FliL